MTFGAIVWAGIGAGWVVWLVTTALVKRLPGPSRFSAAVLGSWGGRAIAFAAWVGAGWHLFCQRP